jgi:hypothetical protein
MASVRLFACGDYGLGGWEELLRLPNQGCPGIRNPELVECVPVVPKDLLSALVGGPGLTRRPLV